MREQKIMNIKKFIYESSVDAFSYSAIFLLTVFIPTFISLFIDNL